MPIYEYRCKACDHETEALQKMSDKPLRKCPECGRLQLQRLISAPSFRLKGGGWYETDFKSDKESRRNIAGEADKGSSDSKSDSGNAGEKSTEKKSASDAGGSSDTGKQSEKKTDKKADKAADKKAGGKSSSSAVA
jgi:putative FmdB family regulatory protein